MKQRLCVFNPDTDMALANGDENYVPPAQAVKMAHDLAFLPAWYAERGSAVLLPDSSADGFAGSRRQVLPDEVYGLDRHTGDFGSLQEIVPWGWNAGLAKGLRLMGIREEIIPSKATIGRIREHAHRSFSVCLLDKMRGSGLLCGAAVCLRSEEEVKSLVEHTGKCILKAPWSGSGKGLYWCEGKEHAPLLESWTKKILAKQGCLVADLIYDKVVDFAMEFYSDGHGKVRFAGYSLFQTDRRGAYKSNLLASDESIQHDLARYAGPGILSEVREVLEELLSSEVGGFYRGYLGVDMMVCRFEDRPYYRIHPCVEINLRMNMGVVARLLYDRYIEPGKQGCFTVDYFKSPVALRENHRELMEEHPLILRGGRVVSGYLSLTPVTETANYRAGIRIGWTTA